MGKKYILGIDIGTGSVKTILIDSEGNINASASQEYPTNYPATGWIEQNPEDWYSTFINTFKEMMNKADIYAEMISAVGVTGQMVGLTCLDGEGSILRNTISWNDQRATEQIKWLKKRFGKSITQITYIPINQSFTLPKLLWLRENEPQIWKKMYKFQLPKDYIRYRLTRNWYTDYSDASATMLFDLANLKWSSKIAEMVDFPVDKIPEVIPSSQIAGYICGEASRETGIKKGTPVVAGAADLSADNLAEGITGIKGPTKWVTRMGTAGSTSLILDKPVLDDQEVCFCSAHCIPGKYILEVGVHSFGQAYRWFKDSFCKEEILEGEKDNRNPYAIIEEEASSTEVGANGLIFHPFVNGSPYWDPYMKGVFWGITPNHEKKHFSRAILEGTAFCLNDAFELLKKLARRKPEEYLLVGSGSKGRLWSQIICDVLGQDAMVLENCDASLGAAMLAGVGSFIFRNFDEVIKKFVKPRRKIFCNSENYIKYQKIIKRFKKIHKGISDIYRDLEFGKKNIS